MNSAISSGAKILQRTVRHALAGIFLASLLAGPDLRGDPPGSGAADFTVGDERVFLEPEPGKAAEPEPAKPVEPAQGTESLEALAAQHPDWALEAQPAFMRSTAASFPPGSRETAFAPMIFRNGSLLPVHLTRFLLLDSIRVFFAVAKLNAQSLLPQTTVEELHDPSGSLVGFRLTGEDPRTASVLLTPAFAKRFSEALGDPFFAIVPTRTLIYVFRRDDMAMVPFMPEMGAARKKATWPVSLEIFEVSNGGLKAVGTLTSSSTER